MIDFQSVKNTDTDKRKGYDAGKNFWNQVYHIAVDSQVLPRAINVTTADVTDHNGTIELWLLRRNFCE
ncbi:MAG: transposase [Clostridia bacterium]|nr:transposase [Clostridia bacterium]